VVSSAGYWCCHQWRLARHYAKFLSDLALLPGVGTETIKIHGHEFSARLTPSRNHLVALRENNRVHIATARDAASLDVALTAVFGEKTGVRLAACTDAIESEVPMWLDRFDRFGFRFYYRPWELPKNLTTREKTAYDFTREFDFARQSDRAGFVFWSSIDNIDTAEGLTTLPWWDWAFAQAKSRGLPVGINMPLNSRGSTWFYNRHRDQLAQKMPQFSGNIRAIADPSNQGNGNLSWSATTAKDELLAWLRESLRQLMASGDNITTVLEPHDELRHGDHDIFMEYGPVADATWRVFLDEKYTSIRNLNTAWGTSFVSWDEVRVPEVASFAGWGKDALDLAGPWKVGHEEFPDGKNYTLRELSRMHGTIVPTRPPPDDWVAPGFDDSGWPQIIAPGNDQCMFTEARPAIFRRTFSVSAAWKKQHPRLWLHVWDLNTGTGERFAAWLNGKKIGEDTLARNTPHRSACEVTHALVAGDNQLSLRLPRGRLAYRVYLSPTAPRQYPDLGYQLNARWVDFVEWTGWTRAESVRRGMEMIRSVSSDVQIDLMAPDYYADQIKQLAVAYGGNFKNTGHMGAFWADYLPAIMRGAGLPFSLEPGWPAPDLAWFKKQTSLWATEGIQGIDYFIHVGSILWREDIRNWFEENLRQIHLIGKYHAPAAEVAALYPATIAARTGFPWLSDPNTNSGAGYWNWNIRANLMGLYESDGLTESSFASGDAARYKVIIDTNTSIMDEAMVTDIGNYVRAGGTFVTFVQTGRHTPVVKDAWPISRLTGYKIAAIDKLDPASARPLRTRSLRPAPGQDVFSGDWSNTKANGLTLQSAAPDTKDLLLWQDGTTAIGMRSLGKGRIIQVGCKFSGRGIPDRIDETIDVTQNHATSSDASRALPRLFDSILKWRGIAPVSARVTPRNGGLRLRNCVSNNWMHDVWVLWNQSATTHAAGHLVFGDDPAIFPESAHNIRNAREETVTPRRTRLRDPAARNPRLVDTARFTRRARRARRLVCLAT
jgi:hypothetical protein